MHDISNCFQQLPELAIKIGSVMLLWNGLPKMGANLFAFGEKEKQSDIFKYVSKLNLLCKVYKIYWESINQSATFFKHNLIKKKIQIDRTDLIPLTLTPRQFLGRKWTYLKTSLWISWYRIFFLFSGHCE